MPTIDIPDKICPHCGDTRWRIEYRKKPTRANPDNKVIRYRCPIKNDERSSNWHKRNPDKRKEYNNKCRKNYKTDEYRAKARIITNNRSNLLTDHYIKYVWRSNHNNRDYKLTPKEIKTYREHLLIHRQLKSLENVKEKRIN